MFFPSPPPSDKRYFPMLLIEETGSAGVDALVNVWNKYKTLPEEVKSIVTSDEISIKLKELQDKFRIDIGVIGNISLLVRKLFFGEVQLTDLEEKISNMLAETGGGDPKQARVIVDFIQNEILTIKPKPKVEDEERPEEKSRAVIVKMSLLPALSKYEQLGNQLISRERIRIKSQSEPVRPSLLHWIKYYRDELGIGHHDSVQRGNFLFRSENGKQLSAEERERVNLVLKSVEENFPLDIDTERSEIIFPVFQAPPSPVQPPKFAPPQVPRVAAPTQANPSLAFGRSSMSGEKAAPTPAFQEGEVSFSSKHVFPAEKETASDEKARSFTPPTSVNAPAGAQTVPRANPFRIKPVSLGKED